MQNTNWAEAHAECELVGGFMAEPKSRELADLLVNIHPLYKSRAMCSLHPLTLLF